jgi:hypothetical protein
MNPQEDPIRAYIRANAGKHTREAITKELVAAGYDAAQINSAWQTEWAAGSVDRGRANVTRFGLYLFIALGVVGAFGALLIGGLSSGVQFSMPVFWIWYAVVYVAIGYAILRLVGWAVPRFRISGWPAGLLGALLVPAYVVLMFGGCLATFGIAQQVAR